MSPPEEISPTAPPGVGRLTRPVSLIALSFACILLTVISAAAFAGYRAGVSQRESQLRGTQAIDLRVQYDLGEADLAAGRYGLAAERFTYILSIDPHYPGAAEKLAAARAAQQMTATRSPMPALDSSDPAKILALAQQYNAAGDWNGVITQLAILHALDPQYEAVRADGMLFVALRNRGVERILGDEMEAGIFDLDQAEAFGPLDSEAVNYRAWARLYLNAQSYWGVHWEQSVLNLKLLYVLAPNFRDTSAKLYEATLYYAAQLAAAGDYCAAAEQYADAQALAGDQTVAGKHATAQAICLLTPTPTATVEPAADLTALPTENPDAEMTPAPQP